MKRLQVTVDDDLAKTLAHEAVDAGVKLPEWIRVKLRQRTPWPVVGKVVDGGGREGAKAAPAPEQRRVQHSAYTS